MKEYMKRLLRRLAAWSITKTGPVKLMVRPVCQCGRTFVVQFPDIGPLLLVAASQPAATFVAEVCSPRDRIESHLTGLPNDLRN